MVLQLLKLLADARRSAHKDVARLQVRNLWALWTFLGVSTKGSDMATVALRWWEHRRAEISPWWSSVPVWGKGIIVLPVMSL